MRPLGERARALDPRARSALLVLLTALAYYLAMEVSDWWTPTGRDVPLLWLPAGIAYAATLAGGARFALAPVAASLLEAQTEGRGVGPALVLAAGAGLAALVVVFARFGLTEHGDSPAATAVRSTIAGASAAVTAAGMVAAASLDGLHGHRAASYFGHLFLAAFAGTMVLAPCIGSWLRASMPGIASRAETLLMLLVTGGITEAVSSGAISRTAPTSYLLLPALLWGALRTGRRGMSLAVLLIATLTATNLTYGNGPFRGGGVDRGVALGSLLIVVSITVLLLVGVENERRRAERTLANSEKRFRALIENAAELVTVVDASGSVTYQSPAGPEILGYAADELRAKDQLDMVHPDDVGEARELLARMARGEESRIEVTMRHRHRDGHWVELVSRAQNLLDDPAVGGIVVNSRDVTEGRRAERELAEAERRYRTLVERLPLVTYVNGLTAAEPPRYVSPQIEEMLGYPVSAWYDDPRFSLRVIHPEDLPALDHLFVEDAEDSTRAEYRMIAADGRIVWVLDHMVTVRDGRGEAVAVQGFLVDVTERKRLEEQLAGAQRMEALGLLAGGVAHDFNNLLTAIAGYGELARMHLDEPERVRGDLHEVLNAAGRAADLTRQLLAFGRRQVLEHDVVDLNAVVAETRPLLERLLGSGVEIALRNEPGLWATRADSGQLGQVLVNLVVNARDAMPDGGRLTIETANETVEADGGEVPPGEYVVVSVRDTGLGIDPSVRERLFEPFFTTKEVGKGTGLGLAVVYGIVEQSRGHVVVRSEPGRGADFRVFLPRTEARPREPVHHAPELPRGSETVLLVEDEDMVRRLTVEMLERQGYRVVAASSPAEALTVEEPYALLLTDVVMPGMTGPELAERLSGRRPRAAVLFTSGYSGAAVADHGTLADRFLEKPFTLEQLARKVRDTLDAASSRVAR